jgi:hypothetical protein
VAAGASLAAAAAMLGGVLVLRWRDAWRWQSVKGLDAELVTVGGWLRSFTFSKPSSALSVNTVPYAPIRAGRVRMHAGWPVHGLIWPCLIVRHPWSSGW